MVVSQSVARIAAVRSRSCSLEPLSAGGECNGNPLYIPGVRPTARVLSTVIIASTRLVVVDIKNRTQNVDKQPEHISVTFSGSY